MGESSLAGRTPTLKLLFPKSLLNHSWETWVSSFFYFLQKGACARKFLRAIYTFVDGHFSCKWRFCGENCSFFSSFRTIFIPTIPNPPYIGIAQGSLIRGNVRPSGQSSTKHFSKSGSVFLFDPPHRSCQTSCDPMAIPTRTETI